MARDREQSHRRCANGCVHPYSSSLPRGLNQSSKDSKLYGESNRFASLSYTRNTRRVGKIVPLFLGFPTADWESKVHGNRAWFDRAWLYVQHRIEFTPPTLWFGRFGLDGGTSLDDLLNQNPLFNRIGENICDNVLPLNHHNHKQRSSKITQAYINRFCALSIKGSNCSVDSPLNPSIVFVLR